MGGNFTIARNVRNLLYPHRIPLTLEISGRLAKLIGYFKSFVCAGNVLALKKFSSWFQLSKG
jgi:hypothetical protein